MTYDNNYSRNKRIYHSCQHCDYKATEKGNLQQHEKSIHNGVKHMKSIHDEV